MISKTHLLLNYCVNPYIRYPEHKVYKRKQNGFMVFAQEIFRQRYMICCWLGRLIKTNRHNKYTHINNNLSWLYIQAIIIVLLRLLIFLLGIYLCHKTNMLSSKLELRITIPRGYYVTTNTLCPSDAIWTCVIIRVGSGSSSNWRQSITWSNYDVLSVGTIGTRFA